MNDNNDQFDAKEILLKEIDLIQVQIQRMARNSFLIKGWTISLVVGALLLKSSNYQYFFSLIPIIAFWILDAYYLRIERLYRKKYEWVIANRLIDTENIFDLNPHPHKKGVKGVFCTMFSQTLGIFYISLFVIALTFSLIGYFLIP